MCALALAATASLRAQTVPGSSNQAAATLHLQAAKVSLQQQLRKDVHCNSPCPFARQRSSVVAMVLLLVRQAMHNAALFDRSATPSLLPPAAALPHASAPVLLRKVVSAHAASIGDTLLGVPLNCSAGLNADAVQLLQEAGMWQLAASLTARTLSGTERAQALCRWAGHVLQQEGSVWRCVGILTSAGCLSAAVQVWRPSAGRYRIIDYLCSLMRISSLLPFNVRVQAVRVVSTM